MRKKFHYDKVERDCFYLAIRISDKVLSFRQKLFTSETFSG